MKFLIIIFLFSFGNGFSQEIKSNTVDPFTNERTIETSLVPLKQGLSNGLGISYTSVDDNYYLNVVGYGSSSSSIKDDDKIWLVLEDGNVIQFNEQARVTDDGTTEARNVFIWHYFARMADIEIMKTKKVVILRVTSAGGIMADFKIAAKISKNILTLNRVFFNEVNK